MYGHVWTVSLPTTLFLGRLRPPKWLTSTSRTYFHKRLTTAFLESVEGETKVHDRTGYRTQYLWLSSQMHYQQLILHYVARPSAESAESNTSNVLFLPVIGKRKTLMKARSA